MRKSSLAPGFRFHPTDVELVMYFLKRKILRKRLVSEVIAEINIYDFSPWDLPDKSNLKSGDLEWFFFCPKSRKYSSGSRTNRATEAGYWKATGKDREVKYKGNTVATIKTLIFHLGNPPKGTRTDWVLHEYRMDDKNLANAGVFQEAYVLCKLFEKSGVGPKNGAQYGAPFEEEDWDDVDDEICCFESSGSICLSGAANTLNTNASCSAAINMTLTVPDPSTVTSCDNERSTLPFSATQTLNPITSSSALTSMNLTEPGPSTVYSCNNERRVVLFEAAETPNAVTNMAVTEPGPSTITFSANERHTADDDKSFLTLEDIDALLQNTSTQDVDNEDSTTDAPNEDENMWDLSKLEGLSQDGFNMFNDEEFSRYLSDAFYANDLDADLRKLF